MNPFQVFEQTRVSLGKHMCKLHSVSFLIKQLIESERLQLKQIIESTIQQSENSINDNIVKHSELQSKAMNTLKWSIWIIGFISIILLALITFKNFQ